MAPSRQVDILWVENDRGDIRLVKDALAETAGKPTIRYVKDGVSALQFLRREAPFEDAPRPRIVLLDLNLPGKDGRAVLKELKADPALTFVPVVVFSNSDAPNDILKCYAAGANCYIVKPRDLYGFIDTMRSLLDFWLRIVALPPR
jgi:CheY-like chemotaxis protein